MKNRNHGGPSRRANMEESWTKYQFYLQKAKEARRPAKMALAFELLAWEDATNLGDGFFFDWQAEDFDIKIEVKTQPRRERLTRTEIRAYKNAWNFGRDAHDIRM